MRTADANAARAYAMSRQYAPGDVIRHEAFGLGVVVKKLSEHKIEVAFRDGVRLLACSWRRR